MLTHNNGQVFRLALNFFLIFIKIFIVYSLYRAKFTVQLKNDAISLTNVGIWTIKKRPLLESLCHQYMQLMRFFECFYRL